MKVTDADRELVQELADSFDLKLDPWQERLLAIIFASHRQRDADQTTRRIPLVTCRIRHPEAPGIWCLLEPHNHGQHQAGSLTWE